jgi:hypothetical protein
MILLTTPYRDGTLHRQEYPNYKEGVLYTWNSICKEWQKRRHLTREEIENYNPEHQSLISDSKKPRKVLKENKKIIFHCEKYSDLPEIAEENETIDYRGERLIWKTDKNGNQSWLFEGHLTNESVDDSSESIEAEVGISFSTARIDNSKLQKEKEEIKKEKDKREEIKMRLFEMKHSALRRDMVSENIISFIKNPEYGLLEYRVNEGEDSIQMIAWYNYFARKYKNVSGTFSRIQVLKFDIENLKSDIDDTNLQLSESRNNLRSSKKQIIPFEELKKDTKITEEYLKVLNISLKHAEGDVRELEEEISQKLREEKAEKLEKKKLEKKERSKI